MNADELRDEIRSAYERKRRYPEYLTQGTLASWLGWSQSKVSRALGGESIRFSEMVELASKLGLKFVLIPKGDEDA